MLRRSSVYPSSSRSARRARLEGCGRARVRILRDAARGSSGRGRPRPFPRTRKPAALELLGTRVLVIAGKISPKVRKSFARGQVRAVRLDLEGTSQVQSPRSRRYSVGANLRTVYRESPSLPQGREPAVQVSRQVSGSFQDAASLTARRGGPRLQGLVPRDLFRANRESILRRPGKRGITLSIMAKIR
jgi:hypothetical protein